MSIKLKKFQQKLKIFKKIIKELIVKLSIKKLFGDSKITLLKKDVLVICLVKDGEKLIDKFIQYYLKLNIKHIIIIDNNSKDKTLEIAKKYKQITIYQTKLNARYFESEFRSTIIKKYSKDRWCLCVDIDEFFTYPYIEKLNIKELITYLDKYNYSCLITQMIDLFSKNNNNKFDSYKYYEDKQIISHNYNTFRGTKLFGYYNKITNKKIKFFVGGIRKELFNTNNWLTKHSLFKYSKEVDPITDPHFSNNLVCADISGGILHYKFYNNFYKNTKEYIKKKQFKCLYEYENYLKALTKNPKLLSTYKKGKELINTNMLIKDKLFIVSKKFKNFVSKL